MSAHPAIDDPCPLDAGAQRAIDGHCGHCNKHVHRLDGMSACERRALFANATGPICVSYRMPAPRRMGRFGAVIAATLITTAAHAGDPAPPFSPPTVAEALQAVKADPHASDDDLDVLIMGGIRAPQVLLDMGVDAEFEDDEMDDDVLPALPVRTEGMDTARKGANVDATATVSPPSSPSTPSSQARR